METGLVTCPRCRARLPVGGVAGGEGVRCGRCRQALTVVSFPALFRPSERGRLGERVVEGSAAACFFHAGRQAAVACEQCGRFLCELCDLQVEGRHTCPTCLEAAGKGPPAAGAASPGRHTVVLYDHVALALALVPVFCLYLTFITAPAALFVVVRYWNRVQTPVPRGHIGFTAAALLALLQIAGWVALMVSLLRDFALGD